MGYTELKKKLNGIPKKWRPNDIEELPSQTIL